MSQGPPLQPELMYSDIWANSLAAHVLQNVLGPSLRVNYVNGNTALGNFDGSRQRVHADLVFNHCLFPFAFVTNYYLVDVSPENASTEVWLASHRDTSFRDHVNCTPEANGLQKSLDGIELAIRKELVEQRRQYAPPIQPCVKKGSVVLRDLRLWHAGLCNHTRDARVMLAFVHTPSWYQCPAKVVLPEGCRPLVEQWASQEHRVSYNAHFVPADVDHQKVKFYPNFNTENKGLRSMLPDLPKGFMFPE